MRDAPIGRRPVREVASTAAFALAALLACGPQERPDPEIGCGNGIAEGAETCDDGNRVGGDGCSAGCVAESGGGESCVQPGDDDGDGLADCSDPDCARSPACTASEDCDDGRDDDGDGLADCDDPDCLGHLGCWLSEVCDDGEDNDRDGRADCLDPDCADVAGCEGVERCTGGDDEDDDGLVDCDDPDCRADPACTGPEVCDDGLDNDNDGRADCLDGECAGDPSCRGPCGDSRIDAGEECDEGVLNSDTEADACRTTCRAPRCGDGVTDSDEECDGEEDCTEACTLKPFCDPTSGAPCPGDPVVTDVAAERRDDSPRDLTLVVDGLDAEADIVEFTAEFFRDTGEPIYPDGPVHIPVESLSGANAPVWSGDMFHAGVPVEWTAEDTWGVRVGRVAVWDRTGRASRPFSFAFAPTVGPGEPCDPDGDDPLCGPGFECDSERAACAVDEADPCAGVPVLELTEAGTLVDGLGLRVEYDTSSAIDRVHVACEPGHPRGAGAEVAIHWQATTRIRVEARFETDTPSATQAYVYVGICATADAPLACATGGLGAPATVTLDVDRGDDIYLHADSIDGGGPGVAFVRFIQLVPVGGSCDPTGVDSVCDAGLECVDGVCSAG